MKKKAKMVLITPDDKELIKAMLLGPFLPEWKDKRGRIDNSDPTIAMRTGYSKEKISALTKELMTDHIHKSRQKID